MHGGIQKAASSKEHYDHNEIFWKREKISKSQRNNFCKAECTQYSYWIKKFKLERVGGYLEQVWGRDNTESNWTIGGLKLGQILSLAVPEAVQKDNVNQAEAVVLTQV